MEKQTSKKAEASHSIKADVSSSKIYTVQISDGWNYYYAKNMTDAIRKALKKGAYDWFQQFQLEAREGRWDFCKLKGKVKFWKLIPIGEKIKMMP
ncbi:MAG: hypothetical protein UV51_C0016G0001 [Candidatus Woesebacteria bacterium GW2011_GWC1_42_9]|nr:MAG: hypothetical protein UV51_C0016G0001 [Candidatus Woesebacteria bacterium GW2011_GWC1_42_9]